MDAFKIEDISPETLDTRVSYKKDEEPIETIKQENIVLPSYDYGRSQEPLDYETQIRNKPTSSGWQYFCWNSTRTTWSWTGSQAITWVGFIPKMVLIKAILADGEGSMSDWQATSSTTDMCVYWYNNNGGFYTWSALDTTKIIYVVNRAWTLTSRAELTSLDTDWFTLNWTVVGRDVDFLYQCYG